MQEKLKVWDKKHDVWVELSGKTGVMCNEGGFEMSTGWDGLDNPTFGNTDNEGYEKMTPQDFQDYQDRFSYYIKVQ